MQWRGQQLQIYIGVITIAGGVCAVHSMVSRLRVEWHGLGPSLATLILLLVLGEIFPIKIPLRDDHQEITTSTAFMFAILLLSGPAITIVAQSLAAILSDLRERKPWWKAAFNAGQYAVSVTGAALALRATTGAWSLGRTIDLDERTLVAIVASATAFFVLNHLFVTVAVSVAQGAPVFEGLRSEFAFQGGTTMVLLTQGPLLALSASRSVAWTLLFLPAVFAIYRTASVSMDKERLATHDSLTGLPNRRQLRERLRRIMSDATDSTLVLVMLLDVNNFKEVNDTLGHHVGDSLLLQIAHRLREELTDALIVARLGGDEFAIVMEIDEREAVAACGNRVVELLRKPLELQDLPFHIEASVGGALFPEHADSVDEIIQKADVAMYLAKERASGYETYSAPQDRYSPRRLALLGELRRAIDERQLVVHFQPVANVATGTVTRAEALVRWEHPEHGLVLPDEFVPLAEPTGMIDPLTRLVLELALKQCQEWRRLGLPMTVAVNVSARNLRNSQLVLDVCELLSAYNLPADALELEVTEGFLMSDPRRSEEVLGVLDTLGVRISLDDFGTGYSSLGYLKRLPVRELKIDRSFVMNMTTDDDDAAIVSSTIRLARSLGLEVVAEGVESEDVWQQLHALGCDYVQGYFLSRPIEGPQLTRWLLARQQRSVPLPAPKLAVVHAQSG